MAVIPFGETGFATLTLLDVFLIFLTLVVGVIVHELFHVLATAILTDDIPNVDVSLKSLFVRVEIEEGTPKWKVVIIALSPIVVFLAGAEPMWPPGNLGVLLALIAWTIATFPSPGDIYTAIKYRPEYGIKDPNLVGPEDLDG